MSEKVINGFTKGMVKDTNYQFIDSQQYLDAENFRSISSGFSTSGAIENIKGNKFIGSFAITPGTTLTVGKVYLVVNDPVLYNGITYTLYQHFTCVIGVTSFSTPTSGMLVDITTYGIPIDQYIIGGCELRDSIILFTTNNTSSTPTAGRSQIYRLILSGQYFETKSSLELLYDDNLNSDDSYLLLSTEHPIRSIARYESPNIQKVYWTDGYNNLRYINVGKNCTTTGAVYSTSNYWGVDKFELLPTATFTKPVVSEILSGNIQSGMVFYAYRLLIKNGASSAISPISDPLHVVTDNEYIDTDLNYNGDGITPVKTKGFRLTIDLTGNNSFDKLQLIRIYYPSYGSTPIINIAAETTIGSNTSISILDVGNNIGELTVDEFNINSTELFKCEDIVSKDNVLFAANIEKSSFTIDDFDARAVRFKKITNSGSGTDSANIYLEYPGAQDMVGIITRINNYSFNVAIPDYQVTMGISSSRIVANVLTVTGNQFEIWYRTTNDVIHHWYPDQEDTITISYIMYDHGNLTFNVTSSSQIFDPAYGTFNYLENLQYPVYTTYSYTGTGLSTIDATVTDINLGNFTIGGGFQNADDPIEWAQAGWDNYSNEHDGINNYNNPDNDFSEEYKYIYQHDGSTIGAEGPNILIGVGIDTFQIDVDNTLPRTYSATTDSTNSFTNYANPFNAGKLSFQRDEVYRLYIVFRNSRGQYSNGKWICDFRMPSLHSDTYGHITKLGTVTTTTDATRLYLTVKIKDGCWPADAVSAQVYRVPRGRSDRQVVTQCLAIGTANKVDNVYSLIDTNTQIPTYSTNNENIIKLISPELLTNKNILTGTGDYLEFVTSFTTLDRIEDTDSTTSGRFYYIKGIKNATKLLLTANDRSNITDFAYVSPITEMHTGVNIGSYVMKNFAYTGIATGTVDSMGCSGMAVIYANNSFSIEGVQMPIVNYKSNCWNTQYGGNTYEARINNSFIPCSDLIVADNTTYKCEYGDTYINYFDIASLLFDIKERDGRPAAWESSCHQALYIPFESSINTNLRYDKEGFHIINENVVSQLQQEEMGSHSCTNDSTGTTQVYYQEHNLYSYNSVYSQQPLFASQLHLDEEDLIETVFDCQIKASNVKINGEIEDSWTRFSTNEFIEVDTEHGPVNALYNYNGSIFFWQDKAFGKIAVNDRAIIQDNSSSKLVLGTGDKLERYDYISLLNGCTDKFAISAGTNGLYWVDRYRKSIDRFGEGLTDISINKSDKSIFELEQNISTWPTYISTHDRGNNEILFTFANYTNGIITSPNPTQYRNNESFTLCFNEVTDQFTSKYTFIPYIYIPYKNTFLTATTLNPLYKSVSYPSNLLFVHNVAENIQARNNFYGLTYADKYCNFPSKITVLFNPYYVSTKVFDNLFFAGYVNQYSDTADEIYKKNIIERSDNEMSPIQYIKYYNDFQNTGSINMIYKTNLERRERGLWTTFIPRNAITADYDDQGVNVLIDGIAARTTICERMRDKYLICDLTTITTPSNNAYSYRTVLENVGVVYRNSNR